MKLYPTCIQLHCGNKNPPDASSTKDSSLEIHKSAREQIQEHYREIGHTLNTCEAGSFGVGIPWMAPTERIRLQAKEYKGPSDEFIRCSLVGVSTNILELYCEDLENVGDNKLPLEALYLSSPTPYERFVFPFAVGTIVFVAAAFGGLLWELHSLIILILSGAAALGSLGLAAGFCLDSYRRLGFHSLLTQEILRRRGLDQNNINGVHIISVGTKPVTD